MRLGWVFAIGAMGCSGDGSIDGDLPGDTAVRKDLEDSHDDECRILRCGSTSWSEPTVGPYDADVTLFLSVERGEPTDPPVGLFRGGLYAIGESGGGWAPVGEPFAVFEAEVDVPVDGSPTEVIATVHAVGQLEFTVAGFLDSDGNADPADPQPDDGDVVTDGVNVNTFVAIDHLAPADVQLTVWP